MGRGGRIALKALAWVLGSIVAILLLIVPAANLFLASPLKDKLIDKYVSAPLEVTVGHADLSFWRSFPHLRLRLRDMEVSYADDVVDLTVSLDSIVGRVDCMALAGGTINLRVDTVLAHGAGLSLRGNAAVSDLSGESPRFRTDLFVGADIASVAGIVKGYMPGIAADGHLNAALHADVTPRDFAPENLCNADIRGELSGDRIRVCADSVDAFILNPYVEMAPKPNIIKTQPDAFAVFCTLDSLAVGIGSDIRADVSAFRAMAQSTVEPIDSIPIPPVVGWLVADRFYFRGTDSLAVDVKSADIDYTVRRQDGNSLPFARIGGNFGGLAFVSEACNMALEQLSLNARASMKSADDRGDKRRRRYLAAMSGADTSSVTQEVPSGSSSATHSDSTAVVRTGGSAAVSADSIVSVQTGNRAARRQAMPEFLSDKTFRAADIDIRIDRSIGAVMDKWEPYGRIKVGGGRVELRALPLDNRINSLSASFEKDVLTLDSFSFSAGSSDIGVSGTLKGLLQALTYGGVLRADVDLRSDNIDVTEFMAALRQGSMGAGTPSSDVEAEAGSVGASSAAMPATAADSSMLLVIPANVIADIRLDARNVKYDTLVFSDIRGNAAMRQRAVRLSDVHASSDFGSVDLDGFYSTKTRSNISAGFDLRLNDITADRVIALVPQFDTLMPLLKSFKGNLSLEVAATSQLDTNMHFMLPTVNGMFNIRGENLVVDEVGKLKRFTRLLMFRHKNRLDIDDLDVYGTITDNELKVFPFVLSVDRYTMVLNGRQKFDSGFKYKLSLLKSILPFRLGAKFFGGGNDGDYKIRLSNPQYKSGKVPDYSSEVNAMRTELRRSIDKVFDRGTDRVLDDMGRRSRILERKLAADGYDSEPETDLPDAQQALLRKMSSEGGDDEQSPLYVAPSGKLTDKAHNLTDTLRIAAVRR